MYFSLNYQILIWVFGDFFNILRGPQEDCGDGHKEKNYVVGIRVVLSSTPTPSHRHAYKFQQIYASNFTLLYAHFVTNPKSFVFFWLNKYNTTYIIWCVIYKHLHISIIKAIIARSVIRNCKILWVFMGVLVQLNESFLHRLLLSLQHVCLDLYLFNYI